eukprot:366199-Chlamydomonas_euryale.AAC.12
MANSARSWQALFRDPTHSCARVLQRSRFGTRPPPLPSRPPLTSQHQQQPARGLCRHPATIHVPCCLWIALAILSLPTPGLHHPKAQPPVAHSLLPSAPPDPNLL